MTQTNPDALAGVVARVEEGLEAEPSNPERFPAAPNHAKVYVEWVVADGDDCRNFVCHAADLRTLLAALAEARKDSERLDYMDRQKHWTRWMGRDMKDGYTVWPVAKNASFREAIDRARTPQTETPE